jgi:hypothetical protein
MGESASGPKTVVDIGGALRFFVGGIIGQILFALTLGVPVLVAVLLADRFGGNVLLAVAIAGGVGAVLSASIGNVLGRRSEVDWWFVAGALLGPAVMLLSAIRAAMTGADAFVLVGSGAYSVAGLALLLGFRSGRGHVAVAPPDSVEGAE